MGAAGAPTQALSGVLQELQGGGVGLHMGVQCLAAEGLVRFALARQGALAGGHHALAHAGAGLAGHAVQQVIGGQGGHVYHQVDAVQQGAAELALVARHLLGAAAAGAGGVAQVAAGAGVHGCNQLTLRSQTMNLMKRKPKAVSYARFSSGKQGQGTSIERQLEAFHSWLAKNDEFESLSFVDMGVSAYRGGHAKRGRLSHIIELIKDGTLQAGDALVVEAIDRLSRQAVIESLDLVTEMLRSGLRIFTLEDGQVYDKDSLGDSRAFLLIANLQAAHNYSKRLGERVAAAHRVKRADARRGTINNVVTVPWIENGKIKEPFAQLVRTAVIRYLQGNGTRAIAKELNSIIDQSPELKRRYSRGLNATTVKRWLASPELNGDWASEDGIINGCFEPLVTPIEYIQIQEQRTKRRKAPSKERSYELSGVVKCGNCGSSFHTRIQSPAATLDAPKGSEAYQKKSKILYCNCAGYIKNGNCANNTTWPYEVLLYIYRYGLNEVVAAIYMGTERRIDQRKIDELDTKIAENKILRERKSKLYEVTGESRILDELQQVVFELNRLEGERKDVLSQEAKSDIFVGYDGHHHLDSIYAMPVHAFRSLIIDYGYEVSVVGRRATLSLSPEGREEFELIRRSQKYKCYILRIILPEIEGMPEENAWEKFVAIDKEGAPIAESSSESSLIELLGCNAEKNI